MPRSNYARTIYYLTLDEKSATPPLLRDAIEQLAIPIPKIEPEQLISAYQHSKHKILLLDHQQHESIRLRLGPLQLTSPHLETILFNVEKRLHTDTLLNFGNLKGVFYQTETADKLAHGLAEIINGQNWLPRHVSSQLLHYYRYIFQEHQIKATINLTARELQILRCLQTGASNMNIAENLFISEFTVKSHLYQIFKKISVKNRTQAIAWANQRLFS
ncbi:MULTISPECIES: LuxR C-terminal-related transcriptional regulator [Vibrio]|uniref:LuxR C-terminal-related transcriptional regulator n=1 Tax=Vibrio TaxID=662 RepID=UPI000C170074|nr:MULTISPECIES: LuxR C-terminal-related transcriptional regulator [Vibrio]NAW70273.1 DNA-binding response regulator [Vibrio sp. V28_P6S34P95]NAX03801.1 DNA-binding response regulator [Vibrio sp. V30_P3S12P165]NAX35360.1 DNA-binding response regulator [Vibrio sp. V29_P1S30P107]NAX36590.1 DNA-binding response regulator [Vibrio sp. V27_P1S3P104]NAX40724.1 DNA-binding response regulator [Vibrio sp. V26_P1S5P106]